MKSTALMPCAAAILGACSTFTESTTPSGTSDAGDGGAEASADSGPPAVFEVPCGGGKLCKDPSTTCCEGSCTTTTCTNGVTYECNDKSDCIARGLPDRVCCGHVDGQNMATARCAQVCDSGEALLCDPRLAPECGGGQTCQPYTTLNVGGFARCK